MMKKKLFLFLAVLLLVSLFASSVFTQGSPSEQPLMTVPDAGPGEMVDETSHLWFVEFASPPAAAGGSMAAIRRDHNSFRTDAQGANLQYSERFAFNTLWNGVSIAIQPGEVGKLAGW